MMIELRRYADTGDALDDVVGSPRRVRQQRDSLPRRFQGLEAFEGARQRSHSVMNHPPEIEDEPVIAGRQRSDASNQRNFHTACPNITSRFYREERPRARTRSRTHIGDLGV